MLLTDYQITSGLWDVSLPETKDWWNLSRVLGPQVRSFQTENPETSAEKKEKEKNNAPCFQAQSFTLGVFIIEGMIPERRAQNLQDLAGMNFHLIGSLQMFILKIVGEGPVPQYLSQFETSFN